jgi:hypothetical protein
MFHSSLRPTISSTCIALSIQISNDDSRSDPCENFRRRPADPACRSRYELNPAIKRDRVRQSGFEWPRRHGLIYRMPN